MNQYDSSFARSIRVPHVPALVLGHRGGNAPPFPEPLSIELVGSDVVLKWTNPAFNLQAAPTVTGSYTNISGATSPYTTPVSGQQRYFRLASPLP